MEGAGENVNTLRAGDHYIIFSWMFNKMKNFSKKCSQTFFLFLVFLAGGVVALNLSCMKYGVPTHYDGSWFNVGFACFLAIAFGVSAVSKGKIIK